MQGLCDPNSQIKHWYREINGNSSVNVEKLCSFKCMLKCTIMHLLFRFYNCLCLLFFFCIISSYVSLCRCYSDGAFQWKRLENLSSCQGECVQDEQQSCIEKEQFVGIGTNVLPSCICLFDLEVFWYFGLSGKLREVDSWRANLISRKQ